MIAPEWWRALELTPLGTHGDLGESAPLIALVRRALDGGPPATEFRVSDGLPLQALGDLRTALHDIGLRTVHLSERADGSSAIETLASEDGFVQLISQGNGEILLSGVLQGDEFVREARAAISAMRSPTPVGRGRVHLLTTMYGGAAFRRKGCAGVELARGNYSTETLNAYDHVVRDIHGASPCGRLVLVEGPPGTGKTYLLRGVMYAVEQAEFLVIPPHLLPSVVGPALVNALFEFAEELPSGRRVVLVLEDADECLVPRQADNVAAIATLLDLTDGLLSTLTDFRVLVSTNAKHVDIDPAVVRAGRLCRHIHVGALDPAHAAQITDGLLGGGSAVRFDRPVTLADVYRTARDAGWTP
jgi:hypothetical protein